LKNIQLLNPKELEDWGHCWMIQQNVNVNTPGIVPSTTNVPSISKLISSVDQYSDLIGNANK
jgi:hypothetical protein